MYLVKNNLFLYLEVRIFILKRAVWTSSKTQNGNYEKLFVEVEVVPELSTYTGVSFSAFWAIRMFMLVVKEGLLLMRCATSLLDCLPLCFVCVKPKEKEKSINKENNSTGMQFNDSYYRQLRASHYPFLNKALSLLRNKLSAKISSNLSSLPERHLSYAAHNCKIFRNCETKQEEIFMGGPTCNMTSRWLQKYGTQCGFK